MDLTERDELLARYCDGVRVVRDALQKVDDLDRAAPGEWSPRQVVHHLADSEMTSAVRLRRLLVEDAPAIEAYDENAFAEVLRYSSRPIDSAMRAFEAARETSAEILRSMDLAALDRLGTHPDHESYSVADWLRIYADHAYDHARQIVASTAP